jgi:membrane-associated phospholipid phosphatase
MATLLGLAGLEGPIAAQASEPSPPGPITPPAAAQGAAVRAASEPLPPDQAPSAAPGAIARDASEPAAASPGPSTAPGAIARGAAEPAAASPAPSTTHGVAARDASEPAPESSGTSAAQGAAAREASQEPASAPRTCADPEIQATAIRCFPRLLLRDTVAVLGAPARWGGRQWAIFSAEVLGVGALSFADKHIHMGVLPRVGHTAGRLAQDVEPLGGAASFGVLGAFYVAGAATGSEKAKGVAIDGLIASAIASGLISTGLKYAVGRSRPREGKGSHHFQPFSGQVSFPSGHATQAFTVASVIATEYPSPWVQVAAYGPAALVGFARLRHDAHWASDVAAGALIGIGVGRAVARLDLPLRHGKSAHHLTVMPIFGPHEQGVMVAASFK